MVRAGSAEVDITPPAGVHLAGSGMGEHRPAQSVIDPLYARAAVFEQDGRRLCLLSLDTTIVTEEYSTIIRQMACEQFGFERNAVMVHATQTHSAPSLGGFMLDPDFPIELPEEREYLTGSQSSYARPAAERAVQAIGRAIEKLQPVTIAATSAARDDLAFNRRGVRRDGSISMPRPLGPQKQPLGAIDIAYLEGPADPEVGLFCARTAEMQSAAMLLHFTCHPVNVFGARESYHAVSADWPGAWSAAMQVHCMPAGVPLVLNGCCGNVNPWNPYAAAFETGHANALRMGSELAVSTHRLLHSLQFSDCQTLDWRARKIPLAYREVPEERRAEVDRILGARPEALWREDDANSANPAWFRAASTRSIDFCRQRSPVFLYEIQVFRIGDVAFVGLPGEPFVEGQLAIKIASPFYPTYVAHCTSHYVGYLPAKEACARGGHEANPDCTYWAKLAPDSLDRIIENTVDLLQELA